MSQRVIVDGHGQVRCRLDEGTNTMLYIYNRTGEPLGYYHRVNDKTYSRSGGYVGPGDQRMSLVDS